MPTFEAAGHRWALTVHYVGEGSYCGEHAFPKALIGKVASIELVPRTRLSFSNVQFPATFQKHELHGAHDPVGSWAVYKDAFGLEYHVYEKTSDREHVRAGDLKAIIYGPSRQTYEELTGCQKAVPE